MKNNEATLIAKYAVEDIGVEATVTEIAKGYAVKLIDTDANLSVGFVKIFPHTIPNALARATEYALSLVKN